MRGSARRSAQAAGRPSAGGAVRTCPRARRCLRERREGGRERAAAGSGGLAARPRGAVGETWPVCVCGGPVPDSPPSPARAAARCRERGGARSRGSSGRPFVLRGSHGSPSKVCSGSEAAAHRPEPRSEAAVCSGARRFVRRRPGETRVPLVPLPASWVSRRMSAEFWFVVVWFCFCFHSFFFFLFLFWICFALDFVNRPASNFSGSENLKRRNRGVIRRLFNRAKLEF